MLRIVAPDVQSSGILALDVRTSNTRKNPVMQGQVQLKDVALSTADAPLGVEKLNGTLDIGSERVQISNMTGQVGGGQVSVGGSIAYKPNLQFNIALQGQSADRAPKLGVQRYAPPLILRSQQWLATHPPVLRGDRIAALITGKSRYSTWN